MTKAEALEVIRCAKKRNSDLEEALSVVYPPEPIWGFDSKERLLCSSIWFPNWVGHREVVHKQYNIDRGIVLSGVGHVHAISQYCAITGKPVDKNVENIDGFITSANRFVGRKLGAKIAYEAGQVAELKDTIYSEDCLWSTTNKDDIDM